MSENQQSEQKQQFVIQRIYSKDVSFEAPNTPQIFIEEIQPEIKVDLNSTVNVLEQNTYEVVLQVTVSADLKEKTAFLAEVHQAGIFSISEFNQKDRDALLGSYCPNLLFPYVRETISELVSKGGFPQFLLQPVNFDALYAQHLQQSSANSEQPDKKEVH